MGLVFEKTEQVTRTVTTGSQARLVQGCAITKSAPGNRESVWVRGDTTIILGCHPEGPEHETEGTCAEWTLEVSPSLLRRATDATLVICCEREYGGLHSGIQGRFAHIFVNDQKVDLVHLLVIPEGHTDYFYRQSERLFWTVAPMRNCNTVYRFGVPIPFLNAKQPVTVRITIDPQVAWDIDYLALIVNHERKKLRAWIPTTLGTVGGFALGTAWDVLVPAEMLKALFERLGSVFGG